MKQTVVCSIPKSGTYLVAEVLKRIGLANRGLHLSTGFVSNYGANPDIRNARENPEKYACGIRAPEVCASLNPGEFVVGHIGPETVGDFDGVVLFVHRDIRDTLVSFMRWCERSGRWGWRSPGKTPSENLRVFIDRFHGNLHDGIRPLLDWVGRSDAREVAFADVSGLNGEDAQRTALVSIVEAVGADGVSLESLRDAIGAETLTYSGGSPSRFQDYWSDSVEAAYRAHGFDGVNNKLGYGA